MSIALYNPDDGTFQPIDQGRTSEYALLLNILIELRVQSQILHAQNNGIVNDDLNALRADQVNDPITMKIV